MTDPSRERWRAVPAIVFKRLEPYSADSSNQLTSISDPSAQCHLLGLPQRC